MTDPRSGRPWTRVRMSVLAAHGMVCHRCGRTIHHTCHPRKPCGLCATIDHWPVPYTDCAQAGIHPHNLANLRPCCRACNTRAGAILGGRRLAATQQLTRPRPATSKVW